MAAISITVGSTDIAARVIFARTKFTCAATGSVGTCEVHVRDDDRSMSFTVGQRIRLQVDGQNVWDGYLMKVSRTYPFDYASPSQREFVLSGSDVNILFQRRWVYNTSNPLLESPAYPAYTADTTVLSDLFSTYLDLSGDGIDTSTHVAGVGNVNEDESLAAGAAIWVGQPWGTTMSLLNRLPCAVWYINPDRQLVWADVDVEDAPYELSDSPTGAEHGCQGLKVSLDATSMVNDDLFIGIRHNSPDRLASRYSDAPSVAAHGRWQTGGVVQGIESQAHLNRIASSVVYGSPENHHGHKDDNPIVTCTVFEPGIRVGMKVRVRSRVFNWTDVVPVRSMGVSFPTPTDVRYELTLSHMLDPQTNLVDPYKYTFPRPVITTPSPPLPVVVIDCADSGAYAPVPFETVVYPSSVIAGMRDMSTGTVSMNPVPDAGLAAYRAFDWTTGIASEIRSYVTWDLPAGTTDVKFEGQVESFAPGGGDIVPWGSPPFGDWVRFETVAWQLASASWADPASPPWDPASSTILSGAGTQDIVRYISNPAPIDYSASVSTTMSATGLSRLQLVFRNVTNPVGYVIIAFPPDPSPPDWNPYINGGLAYWPDGWTFPDPTLVITASVPVVFRHIGGPFAYRLTARGTRTPSATGMCINMAPPSVTSQVVMVFHPDAGQTIFALPYQPSWIVGVAIDGVLQDPSTYTVDLPSKSVTIASAVSASDTVTVTFVYEA